MAVDFSRVAVDVSFRTQHSLLFAGKEHKADSPAGHKPKFFHSARHIDHQRRVHTVILRARSQIPGIQVSS